MSRIRRAGALAVLLVLATACAARTRTGSDAKAAPPTAPAPAEQLRNSAAAEPADGAAPLAPAAIGTPADHVKDKDGALHKRGYKRPIGDCTSCHGTDLRGEDDAPSCYRCHDKKWH